MSDVTAKCRVDLPYPPVEVSGKNMQYACLLLNDYGGQVSEMTAITQYFYQHVVLSDEKVSDMMECVSIVEMHHLEMLGEMIWMLGGDPKIGGPKYFWSGHYPAYCTNCVAALTKDIESEKTAIATYQKRIEQISDEKIQKVLHRIILDEQRHVEIFTELLAECFTK